MITIVNRKIYRGESIYIGRPSVLGNPFRIGPDGDRPTVLVKYRRWLWNEIQRRGLVFEEVQRLAELAEKDDLILGCWCAPQPCHGAVLKSAITWLTETMNQQQ